MNTLFDLHEPKPEPPKVMAQRVARPKQKSRRSGRSLSEYAFRPTIAEFPAGLFVRIEAGPVRPDDLVWSVMVREWQRADWPHWTTPADLAENCEYVIREVGKIRDDIEADRNYTIRR